MDRSLLDVSDRAAPPDAIVPHAASCKISTSGRGRRASAVGGMLSLNVNVSRWRGGASPSRSCALVMNCGAGTMQEDHTRSLLKSQGSSRSCRQDTALGVHYGRNVVVAWKRSPVAVPGRDRRFRQSHPTVSCSPCHVHHKSVGGRLLKTRPWPATRKRYNLPDPRLHQLTC